jgi:hypothetical protein
MCKNPDQVSHPHDVDITRPDISDSDDDQKQKPQDEAMSIKRKTVVDITTYSRIEGNR